MNPLEDFLMGIFALILLGVVFLLCAPFVGKTWAAVIGCLAVGAWMCLPHRG